MVLAGRLAVLSGLNIPAKVHRLRIILVLCAEREVIVHER